MSQRRFGHPAPKGAGLELFQAPRHQPFLWPGGAAAALLIHGFPGTPAEMRPVAELLQPMGWTVQGLLLPGFGAELANPREPRYEEWLAVTIQALTALRSGQRPVMLVGYSMGGALALSAAALSPADGIILLAPFVLDQLWPYSTIAEIAGRLLLPDLRPFRRADPASPQPRADLFGLLRGIDPDDFETRQALREAGMPLSLLGQVARAGWQAYLHAPEVRVPALVVQGRHDEAARAWRTRALVARLAGKVRVLEVEAGHRLIGPANLAWPTVQEAIMGFAARLEEGQS